MRWTEFAAREARQTLAAWEAKGRTDPLRRQRFTIAHEVGHYRLHVVAGGVAVSSYACSATSITSAEGSEATPRHLREQPLPGFVAPAPVVPAASSADMRRWEIEANAFAVELLMPARLVEQAAERYGKNVAALAELFDVSRLAMQYRLEKLLLLPPAGPQTSFLIDL